MALGAFSASAQDWGNIAVISDTMGNNAGRLCVGEGLRVSDIGCPSYAPSVSTAGHVSITGNVSANKFIGDGSGLSGIGQGDRIISDTHTVIVNEATGYVSMTTGGSTWGYLSAGWNYLANLFTNTVSSSLVSATNVSATYVDATRNGTVSGTYGYFRYISGTSIHGTFTGDGSGLTGIGQGDRIVSGSTNAIAWQDKSLTISTAGAQRMIVGENGNVGIGAPSPIAALHIKAAPTALLATQIIEALDNPNPGVGPRMTGLELWSQAPTGTGRAYSAVLNIPETNGDGNIVFKTRNNTVLGEGTTGTEKVRITSMGNVGIGIPSPTATLQVSGTFMVSTSAQVAPYPSLMVDADGYTGLGITPTANTRLAIRGPVVGAVSISTLSMMPNLLVYPTSGRAGIALVPVNSYLPAGSSTYAHDQDTSAFGFYHPWTALDARAEYKVFRIYTGGETGTTGTPAPVGTMRDRFYVRKDGGAFFDSAVGIGTMSPGISLSVVGEVQVSNSGVACGSGTRGAIRYTHGTGLQFCNGSSFTTLGSSAGVTGTGSATAVAYWSGPSALSYDTDGFYWNAITNRLGVGTNLPTSALHVSGSTNGAVEARVGNTNAGASAYSGYALDNDAGGIGLLWAPSSGNSSPHLRSRLNLYSASSAAGGIDLMAAGTSADIRLYAGGTSAGNEAMRITSGGGVGVGTQSPTATLQVSGTFTVSNSAQITTPSFHVGSNGFVGVGTNNPVARFVIKDNASGASIRLENTNSDNFSLYHTAAGLQFYNNTDAATALLIGSANQVGISRSTPKATLDVNGTISASDAIQVGQSTLFCSSVISGSIRYNTTSDTLQICTGSGWKSLVSGTAGGGGTLTGTGSATAVAYWSGNNGLTYDSDGFYWNATNNLLGIGTNTPGSPLHIAGTFSAPTGSVHQMISALGTASATTVSSYLRGMSIVLTPQMGAFNLTNSVLGARIEVGTPVGAGSIARLAALELVESTDAATNAGLVIGNATQNLPNNGNNYAIYISSTNHVVLGDGNVGIGTVAPSATLNISASAPVLAIDKRPGSFGVMHLRTNGTVRWSVFTDNVVEGGSNAGSNFGINRYSDSGGYIGIPFSINRATGNVGISKTAATAFATLDVMGTISASNAIQVGQSSLACGTQISGSIRYNTTSDTLQICTGDGWKSLVSGTVATSLADLADTTITNVAGRDYLRYDNATSKWVNISESTVMSTTTMVDGWPDAIKCTSATYGELVFYHSILDTPGSGYRHYRFVQNPTSSLDFNIAFNASSKVYASHVNGSTFDCVSNAWSISQLYAQGRAFNFIGNALTGSGALGDRITSGTVSVTTNPNGYISLTTGVTDWGYFSSGASYLPTIVASRVSTTNVSATYVQLSSPTTVLACNSGFTGAMRYTSGTMQVCDGSNWGNIGIGVPTGTIAAFSATSCPAGWSEYTASRGRFLRGYDNGAGNDPDGNRTPGTTQADEFKAHTHPGTSRGVAILMNSGSASRYPTDATTDTGSAGGSETRPKNVTVIFCSYSGFQSAPGQTILTTLASLTDVVVTGATTGQVLAYNGTNWVASNSTPAGTAQGDRIVSGTTNIIANEDRSLTFTTAGSQRMVISENGRVGIGTTAPELTNLHIMATTDPAGVLVDGIGSVGPNFMGRRANGVLGALTAVQTNDALATLNGFGYGATGYSSNSRGSFRIIAAQGWTDSAQGTAMVFATTNSGTTTRLDRMRIAPDGNVGINTSTPLAKLDVNGTISASDAIQVGSSSLACSSAISGSIRYSYVSSTMEYCNSTAWVSMGPSDTVPISFRVDRNGTNQTGITAGAQTLVDWTNKSSGLAFDSAGAFDLASDRFVAPIAGNYLFSGHLSCTNSTTYCQVFVRKNGSVVANGYNYHTSAHPSGYITTILKLSAGDYVDMAAQTGGGTTLNGDGNITMFSGSILSPQGGGSGGSADNLGDHTATQNLAMGAYNIVGTGQVSMTLVSTSALDVYGDIRLTGVVTDASDERLKTDIKPLSDALAAINRLGAVSFRMKDGNGQVELGFIAQEVRKVFPQLVLSDGPDGYLRMNYIGLLAPVVKAIQETNARFDLLQGINDNLRRWNVDQNIKIDAVTEELEAVRKANASLKATVSEKVVELDAYRARTQELGRAVDELRRELRELKQANKK